MPHRTHTVKGPLFIVGMPRSGTKLLRGIITRHERISIPDAETEFLPYWVSKWDTFGELSQRAQFERFHAACRSLPFFMYLEKAGTAVDARAWYENCQGFSPSQVFEGLLRTCLDLEPGDGTIWGDKSPSYLTRIELLRSLYPDAKFVHIIRDVRDYCMSMNKAWGKNVYRAAQRWSDDVAKCREAGNSTGSNYLEIRYEKLLDDPPATIRTVCEFLGVSYHADLLRIPDSIEKVGDATGTAGILRSNVRKFEDRMPVRARLRIEAIAGQTLREAGYHCPYRRAAKRIGPIGLRVLQVIDGLNLIVVEARQWGFVAGLRFVFRYFRISGNRQGTGV